MAKSEPLTKMLSAKAHLSRVWTEQGRGFQTLIGATRSSTSVCLNLHVNASETILEKIRFCFPGGKKNCQQEISRKCDGYMNRVM